MKYFEKGRWSIEDLKHKYKELSKKLHPDRGGSDEEFSEMTNEYHQILKQFEQSTDNENTKKAIRKEIKNLGDLLTYIGVKNPMHQKIIKKIAKDQATKLINKFL